MCGIKSAMEDALEEHMQNGRREQMKWFKEMVQGINDVQRSG